VQLIYYITFHEINLNLLTTTIVAPPSNASKWQMGFDSAFKGLMRYRATLKNICCGLHKCQNINLHLKYLMFC